MSCKFRIVDKKWSCDFHREHEGPIKLNFTEGPTIGPTLYRGLQRSYPDRDVPV